MSGKQRLTGRALFGAPCDETTFLYFRRFLAFKIAAPLILPGHLHWPVPSWLVASLAIVAVVVAGLRKHYWPGLIFIFFVSCFQIWESWPFTINHIALEAVLVLLMLLAAGDKPNEETLSCGDMILLLMLSVWFYSGLQKLFHGYYLSGEYFTLEALSVESGLGRDLNSLLLWLAPHLGGGHIRPIACCGFGAIEFPRWGSLLFQGMGFGTVLAEISVPVLALFRSTRVAGILLLFVFQFAIAKLSHEFDFAFTAFGILLLFTPKIAKQGYLILVALYIAESLWH